MIVVVKRRKRRKGAGMYEFKMGRERDSKSLRPSYFTSLRSALMCLDSFLLFDTLFISSSSAMNRDKRC